MSARSHPHGLFHFLPRLRSSLAPLAEPRALHRTPPAGRAAASCPAEVSAHPASEQQPPATHRNAYGRPLRLAALAALLLALLLMRSDRYLLRPYIETVRPLPRRPLSIRYDAHTGLYTLTASGEDFRILQLTDIHLGGSRFSRRRDLMALQTCERLIRRTLPDLVVVTGDMAFPLGVMSGSMNNKTPFVQFAELMERLGVPWAFTYGNHDTESPATLGPRALNRLLQTLSFPRGGQLLYPDIKDTRISINEAPKISGRCNQFLAIRHADGSLWQVLYLIDSNDYLTRLAVNRYDYIRDDQVDWYSRSVLAWNRREGRVVPSLIFTHIPLPEYRIANQLLEAGDRGVIYHDGVLGEARSRKISCSRRHSQLFEAAASLGSTRGIFCGHDHYNNLSLTYRGIRLTFGRSIDYLAMPGIARHSLQRGGTLITLAPDGGFSVSSCPADTTAGFREEKRN